jgi:predicted Rossmann fold flavoprotein
MGSSGFAYQVAEQFGLVLKERRAGLVPFTFSDDVKNICQVMAGFSLVAEVYVLESGKRKKHQPSFTEPVLFTHRGLSGPAILQLSNYWQLGESIALDLLPSDNLQTLLIAAKNNNNKQKLRNFLAEIIAKNLILALEERYWPEHGEKPINELSNQAIDQIAKAIHHWQVKPSGTEGYRTAEVTLGGVDSDELSSKTMQANKQPGLYFIGEAVDVTGWLGGYNFQWAWSSATAAAEFV